MTFIYGNRPYYNPDDDTIHLSTSLSAPPEYIQRVHESGHRDGVLKGKIKRKLETRNDEMEAEKYAWKYAAAELKSQGLWDEIAVKWASRGYAGHGMGALNFKEMEHLLDELDNT